MDEHIKLEVFYLAKQKKGTILGLSDGPFISKDEANKEKNKKYGWYASEYCILKTESLFQKVIESQEELI